MANTPVQVTRDEAKPVERISVAEFFSGAVKGFVLDVQNYTLMSGRALANLATSPHYLQDLLDQMDDIGVGSLPIVLLAGFFIGAVMVLQTASQFTRFGQTALTGDIVAIALVRELGPTLTGLLVAGRSASGIASELGSMLVTEQVDAMRAMGTDPSRKLVTPRVLAGILMVPLLTALNDLVGLFGGCVAAIFSLRLGAVQFWTRAIHALDFADIMQGMSKPVIYGFILTTVGCYQGLTVKGGTQGVGRATTQAVVVASVLIIAADLFLTKLSLFLGGKLF